MKKVGDLLDELYDSLDPCDVFIAGTDWGEDFWATTTEVVIEGEGFLRMVEFDCGALDLMWFNRGRLTIDGPTKRAFNWRDFCYV